MNFRFEKLDVWHRAIEYSDRIYTVTHSFPDVERFGLISQMRRASVSISSNIAEGSGRGTDKGFSRFVEIAYSSLVETISQAHVAKRQNFLAGREFENVRSHAFELARMLSGLRKSLNP